MTPLDRLRIEKASADCGFEMTPFERDGGLELRSARFPEAVLVQPTEQAALKVSAPCASLLDSVDGADTVTVADFGALYEVLRTVAAHARTLPNRVADAFRRETDGMPRSTEAERVVVERVGQNMFRAALLDYWRGQCCVTGLAVPELLRASHIKPWASCSSDDERLDVFNGLLLAPHLDALFDGGWMTVNADGVVLLSTKLSVGSRKQLGLPEVMVLSNLRNQHRKYLDFHRSSVFRN